MMDEQQWRDRVNFIDPFFGDLVELGRLLDLAPTQELHTWLAKVAEENVRFKLVMENRMEPGKTTTEESNWIGRLKAAQGSDTDLAKIEGDKTAPPSIRSVATKMRKLLAETSQKNKIEEILETIEKDIATQDNVRATEPKARCVAKKKSDPGLA